MDSHYIYILQSQKDFAYYIGSSKDPQQRLIKHNRPHKGYTARKQPWKLIYTEKYKTKTEALKREKFLKDQKSKEFIKMMITKNGSSVG